ncbi:MAG: hypothetical protein LUE86_01265 [Clostridiales bacterium]|nr:hypothetical protein [Clostridiales bacterium]
MKKCMIALFFAILLLPNLIWQVAGTGETVNTENRELAEWPELSLDHLEQFPSGVENYINDHAPFRSDWINTYASLNLSLFHSIDHTDVIVGKENWLFYKGNETVIDTLRICPFSEEEMSIILEQLLEIRDKYAKNGREFVFLIVPNKETIYSQYLPDCYAPLSDISRAEQLTDYIRSHSDIHVLFPVKELQEASLDNLTYYRTDTHWNALGALIGSHLLIEAAGGMPPDANAFSLTMENGGRGDLGDLGHTPMSYIDETYIHILDYLEDVDTEILEYDGDGSGLIRTTSPNAPDTRSIAMVRDSFAEAMVPILSRNFQNMTLINWKMLATIDPAFLDGDVFAYEIAERNLGRLQGDLATLLEK